MKRIFAKKYLLRLIGAAIFLWLIFFKIDLAVFYQTIKQINSSYLILLLILFVAATLVPALRWKYILSKMDIKISFSSSYLMTSIGMFLGIATPARLGEIGSRVAFFSKNAQQLNKSLAAVVLEKLTDVMFLVIFAGASALFFINILPKNSVLVAVLSLVAAFFALFLNYRGGKIFSKIAKAIVPPQYENFHSHLDDFFKNLKSIGLSGKLGISLWTSLLWFVAFLTTYLFARSFEAQIPFFYFFMASAIASLTSVLPISFAGLGTREAAYLILLTPLQIPAEKIIAFSLGSNVFFIILLSLAGFICLFFKPKNITSIDGEPPKQDIYES